ncbi:MAG: hypothetical protein R3F21_13030 [Myxococcota bacterium]
MLGTVGMFVSGSMLGSVHASERVAWGLKRRRAESSSSIGSAVVKRLRPDAHDAGREDGAVYRVDGLQRARVMPVRGEEDGPGHARPPCRERTHEVDRVEIQRDDAAVVVWSLCSAHASQLAPGWEVTSAATVVVQARVSSAAASGADE